MKISILTLLSALNICTVFVLSKLSIVGPAGLQEWWNLPENEEETHVSLAAFGSNPWGRTIFGVMELANPLDACSYIEEDELEFKKVHIMVAKRGSCKFVQKAHYAQLAGAEMLIIVDNLDEDVDTRLMVDDGILGESVHIPVGLLGQKAGEKIIQSLNSEDELIKKITAIFDFSLPQAETVEYHLWLSSSSKTSFKLVEEWKPYYERLKSIARMQPLYAHFHDFEARGIFPNPSNCVCGRRYCAPDPDGLKNNNGRDVILEDLRQLCLFHEFSEASWWTYVTNYDTFCLTDGTMEECSKHSLVSLGIDWNVLNACVKRSFDDFNLDTCNTNSYLESQYQLIEQDGLLIFPSASINNNTIRGNVLPPTGIFEAICTTFKTMPQTCREYFHMPDAMHVYPGRIRRSHLGIIISAVIFLIVFILIVTICYRRWLKRELRRQMLKDVNVAVAQYIAFKDADDRESSRIME